MSKPQHLLCNKLLCCVIALINHSLPVYADANVAILALCSYQLKESSQQSIIIYVPPCSLLHSSTMCIHKLYADWCYCGYIHTNGYA